MFPAVRADVMTSIEALPRERKAGSEVGGTLQVADNSGIQRLIARALSIAIPIAIMQLVLGGGWSGAQSVADLFRTSLLLANVVALVLVIVDASWPSIRETFGFQGVTERLASIVTVTLGVLTSMMVLSYLQALLEGTSGGHEGHGVRVRTSG